MKIVVYSLQSTIADRMCHILDMCITRLELYCQNCKDAVLHTNFNINVNRIVRWVWLKNRYSEVSLKCEHQPKHAPQCGSQPDEMLITSLLV